MDEITIRSGRPGDARGIARLDVETWRATYAGILAAPFLVGLSTQRRELGWATVIEREPHDVRVAVNQDGHILGFGSCGRCRGEPEFAGEVFTLYVAPDWQNQGIGRRQKGRSLGLCLARPAEFSRDQGQRRAPARIVVRG